MKCIKQGAILVAISCLALSLSGCGEQTFEQYYKSHMEEIGNDVTGLKVFAKTAADGHGLAIYGRIVNGELVEGPSMKPYTVTSDGYETGMGSDCGSGGGVLGTGHGYAYCGPLGKYGSEATMVMIGEKKAKIFKILGKPYWYGIADKKSLTVRFVDDAGNTVHQLHAGF